MQEIRGELKIGGKKIVLKDRNQSCPAGICPVLQELPKTERVWDQIRKIEKQVSSPDLGKIKRWKCHIFSEAHTGGIGINQRSGLHPSYCPGSWKGGL